MDTRKEYTKPTMESGVLEQTSLTCNVDQEWSGAIYPFYYTEGCYTWPAVHAKNGAFAVEGPCDWIIWPNPDLIVAFS